MTRLGLLLLLITATAFPLIARQAAPTFDVASLQRAAPPQPTNNIVVQGSAPGTFNRTANVTFLIEFGYDLQDYQVIGGPTWVREDRFEIAARAGRDVPLPEL